MKTRRSRSMLLDALESRRLLTFSPHIQLLNNQAVIPAGQAIFVNAVQTGLLIGADLGVGSPLNARYPWDFGDASPGTRFNQLPGFSAGHVYDMPGMYLITLTVTNEAGEIGTAQQPVRVVASSVTPQAIFVDNTL